MMKPSTLRCRNGEVFLVSGVLHSRSKHQANGSWFDISADSTGDPCCAELPSFEHSHTNELSGNRHFCPSGFRVLRRCWSANALGICER